MRNLFGLPPPSFSSEELVARYVNRAARKIELASWHLEEFGQIEAILTGVDMFDWSGRDRFRGAEAHADGCLVQLSAAFDSFSCAVAHRQGRPRADWTDFDKQAVSLARRTDAPICALMRSARKHPHFAGLTFYRNLATHRGMVAEKARCVPDATGRDQVTMLLPATLPANAPDDAEMPTKPVLERYCNWTGARVLELVYWARTVWGVIPD